MDETNNSYWRDGYRDGYQDGHTGVSCFAPPTWSNETAMYWAYSDGYTAGRKAAAAEPQFVITYVVNELGAVVPGPGHWVTKK